jgi:predicted HAD superfamily phosphohydrolase YqeG
MSKLQETIERQIKQKNDAMAKEMSDRGDAYFDILVKGPNKDLTRLPESTFVVNFLPYFNGKKSLDDNKDVIALWISIAGSTTKEVMVVNNNNEPLYTVPAMNDTSIFDMSDKNNSQKFQMIVQNFQMYSNITPVSGQNYLENALGVKIEKLRTESTAFIENEKRWLEIFARYDESSVQGKNVKHKPLDDKLPDDDMIYE